MGGIASGGMGQDDRDVHHVDADIGVRRVSVAPGPVFRVVFRLLDLAFLHDLLALDHITAAVGTNVLALFPRSAAASAVAR